MAINIKNVYLTFNVVNDEQKEEETGCIRFENGVYSKRNAPDGVYILTDEEGLILPEFWGLHKRSVTPVGVAVIEDGRRILIDKEESDKELEVLYNLESIGKEYGDYEDALKDFSGGLNTKFLVKKESPAALYCTRRGKHLPSIGEMKLANKHREW